MDGSAWWNPAVALPPPAPPQDLGPFPQRPECLFDCFGTYLADPAGNLIGFDTNWGRGGPLARFVTLAGFEDLDLGLREEAAEASRGADLAWFGDNVPRRGSP